MKTLLSALFCLLACTCFGQTLSVDQIFKKVDDRLDNLNTLSYWIDYDQKYLSKDDTTRLRGIVYLKGVPEDSLNVHHHLVNLTHNYQQIYNGDNILYYDLKDSSSLVTNTKLYGYSRIKGNINKYFILYELFNGKSFSDKLQDAALMETQVEEVNFEGKKTYAIHLKYKKENNVENLITTYYIRHSDFFPIGFVQTLDFMGMSQYSYYSLSNIHFNPQLEENLFDLDENIIYPSKLKNYVPKEQVPLLVNGMPAPAIEKNTIDEEPFNLEAYRGKVVVLDFWYRSCYPCLKALPELQKIAATQDPSKVVVVGVNPFDKKEKIVDYLQKKGITYPNIYDSRSVANDFKVTAYPTLYVIGKDGKIHAVHEGWNENFYEEVMDKIESAR